jgi:4-amino-4-deoxy-L-arabinose transferase-like glycosyltransferase
MSDDARMTAATTPRRRLGRELVLVVVVSLAVLVPGIWSYSLVDPWETHYGEVARNMLKDGDFVHTKWPGISYQGAPNEGFRSKPVLSFWMMAASMRAVGVAEGGGYSGELTATARVLVGVRIPFILCAIAGLTLMWWMLARLVSRRLAWLSLLVVGSTPIFCLMSRQAIPDMPLAACTIGALSLFLMAVEDGDRPITRFGRFDARHVVVGLAGLFVLVQALYYAVFFTLAPRLGISGRIPNPAIWLPGLMVIVLGGLSRDGWLIVRLPFVALGGIIAAIVRAPIPERRPEQSRWRHVFDDVLAPWERYAVDRYLIRALPLTLLIVLVVAKLTTLVPTSVTFLFAALVLATTVIWALTIAAAGWAGTNDLADRLLGMSPITTMRQLFMLGCYFLLGVSLLAKGPPGLVVVGGVGLFYVVCFGRWRALWEGAFEVKRGLLLILVVAIPWHIGMWLKEGQRFISEYLYEHILNRAGDGSVDKSLGTFELYTSQIGHGMWLWAAMLPAALGAAFVRSNRETREGRVRFVITLWAIVAVAVFCLVQTKFHHYILPAIPPLALIVACFLEDLVAKRERLHPLFAALGAGIVLLICRDLMFEPERWIEMFVFRYDRPWPSAEPYAIDTSDGFLALGLIATLAIMVASTRFVRVGVALLGVAGLAICLWALHVYMPLAGQHWGMREAARTYYDQRTIYGEKVVYFGDAQLADDWQHAGDTYSFETVIPDTLQVGQPMTVTVQLNKAEDERIMEQEITLTGAATEIGDHSVEITLARGERAKLAPLIARGLQSNKRGRPPVRDVDADRLIAWQLYWRGEQFWSAGEIWAWMPEMRTSFPSANPDFQKYINDRTRAPLGRRYFVIGNASSITGIRSSLPTPRARDSFEVIDMTSNKFWLAAFYL